MKNLTVKLCMLTITSLAVFAMTITTVYAEDKKLTFEDQFSKSRDVSEFAGKIVVLVYGDRKATDECKTVGETLHIAFHPTAKGLSPEKAAAAPVVALANLPAGKTSPDVVIIPVACTGKIPNVVKTVLQAQIKNASPKLPVFLDCNDDMAGKFGMTKGESNMVIFDATGKARQLVNGKPTDETFKKVAQVIQNLRAEAVK